MHTAHCCVRRTPALPASLDAAFSPHRLRTFLDAAGGDIDLARALYIWNRDLSAAFLADIAVLEVAMRNGINNALTNKWGERWFEAGPTLDSRCAGQLATAWDRIPKKSTKDRADPHLPGRVVANLMFGFWTNLLDEGGPVGRAPLNKLADYDALWLVIRPGFKGARAEARMEKVPYRRPYVHTTVKIVNDLRNRAAHHEAFIKGFPLSGQQKRLTAVEGHAACLKLARFLDRDLATWLVESSNVPSLLQHRPPDSDSASPCSCSPHLLVDGYPDF